MKIVLAMALLWTCVLTVPAWAVSVTINPITLNYWAGVNTVNTTSLGSNSVAIASGNGTAVNLAITGQPAGCTPVLSTNTFTNTVLVGTSFQMNNVANGAYSLAITASGAASYSTNVNLFVVPQWAQTNIGLGGNWSDNTKWSGGAAPVSTDGVYIERTTPGPWTNTVNGSRTIQSLIYKGDGDEGAANALAVNTTIATPGTLSVLGTNGFFIGQKSITSIRPVYMFQGDTLLVSNTAGDFVINGATPNATRYLRSDMSGLNSLKVYVNRMAIADGKVLKNGPDGCTLVDFVLAQTNIIKATLTDNYSNSVFNTAISYMRQDQSANNGQSGNAQFRLGQINTFYADSMGVGIGDAPGSGSTFFSNGDGYRMVFRAPDSVGATNSVVFRNSDGVSRMSLLAIGVDQGLTTALVGNRGIVDLRGGKTDMLVDQIWLGQDRTNSANANTKDCIGGLMFDWGKIDCNTLIAANMKYTNNISTTAADGLLGFVVVGTNGTLVVNNNLILGQTPAIVTGFETQAANVSGLVRIDNGGTLRANQINVGPFSLTNAITINSGGNLDVSNNIASSSKMLTTLTSVGGALTLHINGNNTLVYATNLVASASSPINIASVTGISSYPATIHIISYVNATTPNNWAGGVVDTGTNAALSAAVANNSGNSSIDLTLSLGSPKKLIWKGYVNNNWDTGTKNWLDAATLAQTNFSTGDTVIFDDTASFSSVNVAVDVLPVQAGNGILMTNNTLKYVFTGVGRILGSVTLIKEGTSSLTNDVYAEFTAKLNKGSFAVTSAGTVGNITAATNTVCSIAASGTVLGNVTSAGTVDNSGLVTQSLSVQTSGSATNELSGVVSGALSMQTGTYLYNLGNFANIGSLTTVTNTTIVNAGTIKGSALTIGGTLKDTGTGSINMHTALTINGGGVFIPGGDAIGTSTIYEDPIGTTAALAGQFKMLAGSTNIFKVNLDSGIQNTLLNSVFTTFGPNHSLPIAFDGATIIITNTGINQFSAGQSIQLFANTYTGNLGNAGFNTTNSYPVISPSTPGSGLIWDLSTVLRDGTIRVQTVATNATDVVFSAGAATTYVYDTNNVVITGTNRSVIIELTWPSDHIGWKVQQLQSTLATGLSATNWLDIGTARFTNDIFLTNSITIPATFYRMVSP